MKYLVLIPLTIFFFAFGLYAIAVAFFFVVGAILRRIS